MSGEPLVTLCGTAGGDAQLRFTPSGAAVAEFSIAVTPRVKQGDIWSDGETVWYRCQAWRQLGEQVAESVVKGMRLLVHGKLKPRTFEDKNGGGTRTSLEIEVEHVGAEMRYATVKATKVQRGSEGGGRSAPADDPWGSAPAPAGQEFADTEPPF